MDRCVAELKMLGASMGNHEFARLIDDVRGSKSGKRGNSRERPQKPRYKTIMASVNMEFRKIIYHCHGIDPYETVKDPRRYRLYDLLCSLAYLFDFTNTRFQPLNLSLPTDWEAALQTLRTDHICLKVLHAGLPGNSGREAQVICRLFKEHLFVEFEDYVHDEDSPLRPGEFNIPPIHDPLRPYPDGGAFKSALLASSDARAKENFILGKLASLGSELSTLLTESIRTSSDQGYTMDQDPYGPDVREILTSIATALISAE
jgi:hypothetical protein